MLMFFKSDIETKKDKIDVNWKSLGELQNRRGLEMSITGQEDYTVIRKGRDPERQ